MNQINSQVMKNIFIFMILTLAANMVKAQTATTPVKIADTQSGQFYRIPVILKDNDGNLVALYDDRHNSNSDLGSNHEIDILVKKSTDNGDSFDATATIAVDGDGNSTFECGHGDAAAVCDRESGDILVLSASGSVGLGSSAASATYNRKNYTLTLTNIIRIGRSVYSNSTKSWGECTDLSEAIYKLYESDIYRASGNTSGITGMYVSTGRLCQSSKIKVGSHYRVYAVLNTWNNNGSGTNPGPRVICSDDFGETWKALGEVTTTPCTGGDETQIEELPDGNLLLSSRVRSGTGRIFNVFTYTDVPTYATGSWGTAVTSGSSNTEGQTYAASCNASLMIVKAFRRSDNSTVDIILQSACMSSNREKMGIYWKELPALHPYKYADFKTGWSSFEINNTYACYSSMVQTKDGKIGIFYESHDDDDTNTAGYYDLVFSKFSLEDITGNAYSAMTFDEGMEPRVMLLKSVMSGDMNESRYIYNDGMTMKTVLSTTAESASSPDYNYYWVLNRDPGSSTYYFSALSGDGYIGMGKGINLMTGAEEEKGTMLCTTKYAEQFDITGFTKELSWTDNSSSTTKPGAKMSGYALQFPMVQDSQVKQKVVAIPNSDSTTPNWLQETEKCWLGNDNSTYWTSDINFTDATYVDATEKGETCGTWKNPTYYGFKVTFGRSDDGKATAEGEDYNYYATLKLPYAVTIPDDVTAYRLDFVSTQVNGHATLVPMELEDRILPRETPVLMMIERTGDDKDITKVRYFKPAKAKLFNKEINSFRGTLGKWTFEKATTTDLDNNKYNPDDKKIYILGRKNGHMAFYYLIANSEGAYSIGNNKAYFVQPDNTTAKEFTIRRLDATTGIENVRIEETIQKSHDIYDLSGRRMTENVKKGIYIRDGKKYIVK